MAQLVYGVIASLDGYITDRDGTFGWAEPDEEVHAFANERQQSVGTHLYGRRMYETMQVWETDASLAQESPLLADYAEVWQAADKVVFSGTLTEVATARTRIESDFDPDAVRRLVSAATADLSVGGPGLAAHALRAGLVDELQVFVVPTVVGAGGTPYLPGDVRLDLELRDEHRFGGGTVFLRYGVRAAAPLTD